jgi:hypothetical protein
MADSTRGSSAGSSQQSTGALIRRAAELLSRLVRLELTLARAETAPKARKVVVGAGLLAGAGVTALYGVAALLAGGVLGLAEVVPVWAAAAIVAAVLIAAVTVLAVRGRRRVSAAAPLVPTRALESARADVDLLRRKARFASASRTVASRASEQTGVG